MQRDRLQNYDYRKHISDSQNFITNKKLLNRIVNLSNIERNDSVLEIGTGKGHLTEILCQKGCYVYSIEIDRKLFEQTALKFSQTANLQLICGDFLKYSLPARGNYKVFANIPFFLTTKIIEKLTDAPNPPSDIYLIMEKGAAKRFSGLPRETGKSLLLKAKWDMKILYHFRRSDFHPMPHTDVVLLHFSQKKIPDVEKEHYPAYRRFIEHSLKYGFYGKQGLLTKKQVSTALKQAGIPLAYEDGVMLYVQWLCLFRYYQRIHKS
ncbi:MAG: rRNA adenine N(6)-methyltransferase family protein [Roseburia sp.]|nr:rRNA adenine N(6)-methyltransferase family protein [Ruminococcus sp.]MCM1156144.1 rRNA adenine N(6)-methyltransferase family protein [Roseburia sp.]MCM1243604.1 rRNA adenine N(6)-methyltransferase family protein [Roseburia sp.]